ncbi:MAG: class I SAM-dependent methyltransferase [Clostridia bacterium]|nr:class I SAM-dependent methyltransferase [Clostridia bacterium]
MLSKVSQTLYIPLMGRIYASRRHPAVLYDAAALAMEPKLPPEVRRLSGQTEYTLLASAVRSRNVDETVRRFLCAHPDGVIVNVGCGLDTAYQRNDNGVALWFDLDMPDVISLRRQYFPLGARERELPYSMFDGQWVRDVQAEGERPLLAIASGLFYYFPEKQVIEWMTMLSAFPYAELAFDAVSSRGIAHTRRFMRRMKKQDAQMFFALDDAKAFAQKIPTSVTVLGEERFYRLACRAWKASPITRVMMWVSDKLQMVKMVRLRFEAGNNSAP